ncbi:MAG: 50S ribosomal protein L25 [Elusimicrobia bacterium]|nr:50S ribosomal protein L25 [Elusimicrobiota bacterium]
MEQIILTVDLREKKTTKGKTKALRQSRKVPAVIYGGKKSPLSVVVTEEDLLRTVRLAGANAILTLKHPEGSDTVILKQMQRHVVTDRPIHIDFQRISMKEKIEVKVPLKIVGEAPGVKLHGGILEHILRELKIRCLPTQIPHDIEVDVTGLEIGHGVAVKDLKIPQDLEVLEDLNHIIVNVVVPTEEEAPVPEVAAVASTEPEVISKGKKEEEAQGEGAGGKPQPEKGKEAPPAKK